MNVRVRGWSGVSRMLPRDRYLNVVNMVSRRLQREWNRVQVLPNRDLEVTTERTCLRLNVVNWNRFPPNVAKHSFHIVWHSIRSDIWLHRSKDKQRSRSGTATSQITWPKEGSKGTGQARLLERGTGASQTGTPFALHQRRRRSPHSAHIIKRVSFGALVL